jgi:hypothetical protein
VISIATREHWNHLDVKIQRRRGLAVDHFR